MVLQLADRLEVPLRDRNQLLLAAGHAPVFGQRGLDDPEMAPVRDALDLILEGHDPYPAVVVDRAWERLAANRAVGLLIEQVTPGLLEPPVNVMRVSLHPEGLAPQIANLGEWRAHLLGRLRRQTALTGDPALAALLEEVSAYPGPDGPEHAEGSTPLGDIAVPLRLRTSAGELALHQHDRDLRHGRRGHGQPSCRSSPSSPPTRRRPPPSGPTHGHDREASLLSLSGLLTFLAIIDLCESVDVACVAIAGHLDRGLRRQPVCRAPPTVEEQVGLDTPEGLMELQTRVEGRIRRLHEGAGFRIRSPADPFAQRQALTGRRDDRRGVHQAIRRTESPPCSGAATQQSDPNDRIRKSLSAIDRAAYDRALWGENPGATFQEAADTGDFSELGGCTKEATDADVRRSRVLTALVGEAGRARPVRRGGPADGEGNREVVRVHGGQWLPVRGVR